MAENSTVVETVFTLVDQASAKVEKLSSEFIALQEQAMAAKAAVSKSATVPGGAPEITRKTVTPQEATFAGAQAETGFTPEQRAGMSLEKRVERERQWAAREAAEKHRIGAQIVHGGAVALGASMNDAAGRMLQLGGVISGVGIELAQFKGKAGQLGALMAKAGPVVEAFAAGMAIGKAADDWLGISDWVAGVDSVKKVKRSNDKFAKSLGYRDAAEYEAAQHTLKASQQQVKLQVAAKKYGADLGALPANATAAEMTAYNTRLRKAGIKILQETGLPASMMGDVMREVSAQAAAGLPAQQLAMEQKMEQDARLATALKKQAVYVGSLPVNATDKELREFNARMLKAGVSMLSTAEFFGVSLEEYMGMLKAQSEAGIGAATVGLREKTNKELVAQDKEETSLKQLNKMELKKGVASRQAYNEALIRQANDIAREVYGDKAGEHFDEIYRDLRSQSKLDKTKTAFDFRGSRFDIKQSFAEGIEPGDVSVALTNDIAALAERQLTSGFSPIFGGI